MRLVGKQVSHAGRAWTVNKAVNPWTAAQGGRQFETLMSSPQEGGNPGGIFTFLCLRLWAGLHRRLLALVLGERLNETGGLRWILCNPFHLPLFGGGVAMPGVVKACFSSFDLPIACAPRRICSIYMKGPLGSEEGVGNYGKVTQRHQTLRTIRTVILKL